MNKEKVNKKIIEDLYSNENINVTYNNGYNFNINNFINSYNILNLEEYKKHKQSGILLHISQLPSKYGIGSLGKEAFKFIDFLKETGFSYWEILPIYDVGYLNSPFQVITSKGLNHYLIDIESLIEENLLTSRDLTNIDFGSNPKRVDFNKLFLYKDEVLKKAFKRFDTSNQEFINFINTTNLSSYCLYKVIKERNGSKAWFDFALEDRYFDEEVKSHYIRHYQKEIEYQFFLQFIFLKQWNKLHDYAKKQNIEIIGDLPHFLGYDSDEMYFNPELFTVDKRYQVTYVAGYPSDNFKPQGQKWGYPLYDWDYMKLNHYKWWRSRILDALSLFDKVKLNHFRGFYEIYAIPFRSKSAKRGTWIKGPGLDFISSISDLSPRLIASALGNDDIKITKFVKDSKLEVTKTLIPSLFDNIEQRTYPSMVDENTYYYLGNHDNTTIKTKLDALSILEKEELVNLINSECEKLNVPLLNSPYSNFDMSLKLNELIYASKANHVSLLLSNVLYLGKEARLNTPGTLDTLNWTYRYLQHDIFNDNIKKYLFNLNKTYKRLNYKNFKE